MNGKILVIGSSNTDMIIKIPSLPKPGETVIGGNFFMAAGGKGANQAIAAKKSGADVTFVTRVGEDDFGSRAIEGYTKEGVNVKHIIRDKNSSSGIAFIMVDSKGENSIAVASGANNNLSPADIKKVFNLIEESDIILLQLEIPVDTVLTAVKYAYNKNKMIILNPAPAQKLSNELLGMVSIITPNESEAEILTGIKVSDEYSAVQAAENLLAKGIGTVILTMGSRGLLFCDKTRHESIAAYKVHSVDTTAAGDVFNGALACALGEGMDMQHALKFASAAAAISVTRLGAQTSVPTRHEIEEFIKTSTAAA